MSKAKNKLERSKMGIITEILQKSKNPISPKFSLSKEDQRLIQNGEIVIKKDENTQKDYLVRIDYEKIGQKICKEDLIIERVILPKTQTLFKSIT